MLRYLFILVAIISSVGSSTAYADADLVGKYACVTQLMVGLQGPPQSRTTGSGIITVPENEKVFFVDISAVTAKSTAPPKPIDKMELVTFGPLARINTFAATFSDNKPIGEKVVPGLSATTFISGSAWFQILQKTKLVDKKLVTTGVWSYQLVVFTLERNAYLEEGTCTKL